MKRLLGLAVLAISSLFAQTSIESALIALKDPHANRAALSAKLTSWMMLQASKHDGPAQPSVERFSEDLTTALLGKEVTRDRALEIEKAIFKMLSGKGSTFMPAGRFREALRDCMVEDRMTQVLVDRFTHLGQDVRGPDDLPLRDITRK
jgi:hypothetical protein